MADQLAEPEDLASLLESDLDTYKATMMIECATAVVQAITGQRIVQVADDPVTIDLDHYDTRTRWIDLPERPVTAVASVSIGATAVTDYTVQLTRGRIWRADGWITGSLRYGMPGTVTVTYTHGYPAGHQRLQLARMAVLSLCRSYGNPTGATREQIDDYSVMYDAMSAAMETSPYATDLLRRQYGRPRQSIRLMTGETVLWPV